MEHFVALTVKTQITLQQCEVEQVQPPINPISLLFVLKKMDHQINPILLGILEPLVKTHLISHYFTDQETLNVAKLAYPNAGIYLYSREDHEDSISYVITVGGDGTILYGNRLFQKRITPGFISIQKGTLGFLCKFRLDEVKGVCEDLVSLATKNKRLQCKSESRMRLTCQKINQKQKPEERYECLNEIAINKTDQQSQLRLEIYISEELFTTTAGDGILISTPTGSTAYALSAGGPILHNEVRSILIVPICPKSLSFRPICLPAYVNLKIKLAAGSKVNAFVSCDGQLNYEMKRNEELQISQSVLDLISLSPMCQKNFNQWAKKLNNLLTWNAGFTGTDLGDIEFDRGDSRLDEFRLQNPKRK